MPFVRIETNQDFSQEVIQDVITQITQQVHTIKGDPQAMILVVVNTKVNVAFGGDYEKPAAVVQLMNLRLPVEITTKLTESISDILLAKFNVSANRMYIFFQEFTKMHLVGWNRTTFDRILGADENGTKKSSKLYGIRSTALKAIEQWRSQAVVLDAASWKRSPTAGGYAIAVPCSRQWNQMYKLSKNFC